MTNKFVQEKWTVYERAENSAMIGDYFVPDSLEYLDTCTVGYYTNPTWHNHTPLEDVVMEVCDIEGDETITVHEHDSHLWVEYHDIDFLIIKEDIKQWNN